MAQLKIVTLTFDTEMELHEMPMFRGAVVAALPHTNVLYHNHADDGLRYTYPLVQYKCLAGKAAIVYVGEGVAAVSDFLLANRFDLCIGRRQVDMKIEAVDTRETNVEMTEEPVAYVITHWLPFKDSNYARYAHAGGLAEQVHILERIMVSHILSFLKCRQIFVEEPIKVVITDLANRQWVRFKHIDMLSMDVAFTVNVSLPCHIGLGKHVSMGYGTLMRKTTKDRSL